MRLVTNFMGQERLLENQMPMIDRRTKTECKLKNTPFHAFVNPMFCARSNELGWDLADILPAPGNDDHQGDELLDVPFRLHTLPSLASLAIVVHAWQQLEQSGFYWRSTSQAETSAALASEPEGTFLVRDSSATNCLFTLVVKTSIGPANVRINFDGDHFSLDTCQQNDEDSSENFDSVVALLLYHKECKGPQVWLEGLGKNGALLELVIKRPLFRRRHPPQLQHLGRLRVHRCLTPGTDLDTLDLPTCIQDFLLVYPFQT
uniref:Cytokine-inducible SH2-containing protein n=1 Tax=Eptatretus burgeri TaxID=7764 RepID=A0A8C4PWS3_EPTBU